MLFFPQSIEEIVYTIDPIACDGCAACVYQCPEDAIHMQPQIAGRWYRSQSRYGSLFHADLFPAQENSGKLVTLVKQNARLLALDTDCQVVIVDGPPGIGCPVIAAAAGADLALIVTEPSLAGIHDLARVLETTTHFRIPSLVVINKADLYPPGTSQIEAMCAEMGVEVIGCIPFDPAVTEAMLNGEPLTAYSPDSPASHALVAAWQTVVNRLQATRRDPRMSSETLRQAVLERLSKVIDPETGVDVVRMRLIEDLTVNESGFVTYKFRPSSPFCPIAVPLSQDIQRAVAEVAGVSGQSIEVVNFALAEELTKWLAEAFKKS